MLLTIDQITAGYGHAPVLTGVSMAVAPGEIVCIIGPNGAGKSTVLRTTAGQLIPSSGKIIFKEKNITPLSVADRGRQGLVFIPQGINIFPNLTIVENLEIAGALIENKPLLKQAVREVLNRFPVLYNKRRHFARDLSGGERQILALSRSHLLNRIWCFWMNPHWALPPWWWT